MVPTRRALRLVIEGKAAGEPANYLLVGTDSGIPMKFHSMATWNELDVWVNHRSISRELLGLFPEGFQRRTIGERSGSGHGSPLS